MGITPRITPTRNSPSRGFGTLSKNFRLQTGDYETIPSKKGL